MVDPKLNELPAEPAIGKRPRNVEKEAATAGTRTAREGLSINDTIAGDTNLSVGGRGVDASGVRSGAGAGAGSAFLTPGAGGSPAPNVVPGARNAGLMISPGQNPIGNSDTGVPGPGRTERSLSGHQEIAAAGVNQEYEPSHEEVRLRAYCCWEARGCPEGSPEVDWHTAREQLRSERRTGRTSAATA